MKKPNKTKQNFIKKTYIQLLYLKMVLVSFHDEHETK